MVRSSVVLVCAAVAVLLATPASAQNAPAASSIGGVVVDSSGGAIPGALVALRVAATAAPVTTLTDGAGRFGFDGVPAGAATVTVSREKFTPAVVAVPAERAELRVVLAPLTVAEAITVRAPQLADVEITTATRTPTPLRDVPQAVTIVNRQLMADLGMLSLGDAMRHVPGIGVAQGEGNRDAVVFRGSSSTSDFFVDGVRDDVQYIRDLYNVERIEAFKGPNAMIFGRGGVGGVINRVTRQAGHADYREASLQLGSWDHRRMTADVGGARGGAVAARVTGVYEDSESYRAGTSLERYGINPTVRVRLGSDTILRAGYEHFQDHRTADRGVPSFQGRPVATAAGTFFGSSSDSRVDARVHMLSSALEHSFTPRLSLRSRVSYADYDKFYQNVFPGAVNAAGTSVSISAYSNATTRRNLFSQTDLVFRQRTGRIGHTILGGAELGRQVTDNFRATGSLPHPRAIGDVGQRAAHRSGHDPADHFRPERERRRQPRRHHGGGTLRPGSDRAVGPRQAIAGLRYDSFRVDLLNNRTGGWLASRDGLVSPRLGLVVKPVLPLSLYASYTLSYLPRAGEQLASLSPTTGALEPENFRNYELGVKWDPLPALAVTGAVYQLDRGNVVVADPLDPAVLRLVDAHRARGLEIGWTGRVTRAWSVLGSYAYQQGEILQSLSASIPAGARLAQLPGHTISLWNKYSPSSRWGLGFGIVHRGGIFASADNAVTLPAFTRVDGAVYVGLRDGLRAQVNVENLFDAAYFASAHSNTNIMPGSPRALRVGLTTRF